MANKEFTTNITLERYHEDLSHQAWRLHNILLTLFAALPDDSIDDPVPTRCLVNNLVHLADELASDISDPPHHIRKTIQNNES